MPKLVYLEDEDIVVTWDGIEWVSFDLSREPIDYNHVNDNGVVLVAETRLTPSDIV